MLCCDEFTVTQLQIIFDSILSGSRPNNIDPRRERSENLAQASQAYVTSVLYKRVGVALQATFETLCKRNKILRSVKAKYHYFYFFSTKKIKETYL